MLRFQRAPDAVFQAILRDSLSYMIDFVSDMRAESELGESQSREDFANFFPAAGKVFPPRLATEALRNLLRCLDRPEIYYLNDYHYLLLYDVLYFFTEIHNFGVADSKSKRDKKEMAFVDPFYVKQIDFVSDEDFGDDYDDAVPGVVPAF